MLSVHSLQMFLSHTLHGSVKTEVCKYDFPYSMSVNSFTHRKPQRLSMFETNT